MLLEIKRYVEKINISVPDNILSLVYEPLNQLFIIVFRYLLIDLTESKEYLDIVKSDDFRIYTGELYSQPHVLYRETKERLSFEQLAEKINDKESCKNYDLRDSDYGALELSDSDLRFSDFRNSCLKETNFTSSRLDGVIFKGCDLSGAKLRNTRLSEANFQNANLKGVDLASSVAMEGYFRSSDDSFFSCCFPIDFSGADLSEAFIAFSYFNGVDFTKAKLEGTRFIGSNLSKSKFTKKQLQQLDLSESQLSQIVVV